MPLQEEKFKILADQSPNMIFINLKGEVIYANRKCEEIMEYKKEEFYDSNFDFLSLIAPDSREVVRSSFHKHLNGKEIDKYECALVTKSGVKIDVIIDSKLIAVGSEMAILGVVTDITVWKRAEEKLKESEKRSLRFLELSFDGNVIHQDGKLIYVNKLAMKLFGIQDVKQVLGKPVLDFVHPDYHEIVKKRIQEGSNVAELNEEKFVGLDGKVFDVEVAGIPITYQNKPAWQVTFRDITKRKQAEERLRQGKELYKKLVDTAPDAVIVVDLEGNITNISNRALELYGYENPEELVGKSGLILLDPKELKFAKKNIRTTFKFGTVRGIEYNILKKDGSTFIGEVNGTVLKDANNNPTGFIITVRDITIRKKCEKSLQESEENFRTLAENAIDGLIICSIEGNHLFANRRAAKITGYSVSELLTIHMKDLVHPQEYDKLFNRMQKRLRGDSAPRHYETKIIRKDGNVIPIEVNASKTIWHNQPVSIVSLRDISFRKKHEAELLDYQKQLQSFSSRLSLTEEKERRKIANEIHDRLGQSLILSKMKLSELLEDSHSEKSSDSLQELRQIIESLIEETRTLTFELSPPVLYELGFEPAIDWLAEQFQNRHNISIQIKDDGKEKSLNSDIRFILFDAVRELLLNVIKHAKAKNVNIHMKKRNGFLSINIEDDGVGFDLSVLKTNRLKNHSFGYFQIKERLKLLNGELKIETSPGKGTNVSIKAPLK